MRAPFRIKGRDGWHAEIKHPDGRAERRRFDAKRDADEWLDIERDKARVAQGPVAGIRLRRQ